MTNHRQHSLINTLHTTHVLLPGVTPTETLEGLPTLAPQWGPNTWSGESVTAEHASAMRMSRLKKMWMVLLNSVQANHDIDFECALRFRESVRKSPMKMQKTLYEDAKLLDADWHNNTPHISVTAHVKHAFKSLPPT